MNRLILLLILVGLNAGAVEASHSNQMESSRGPNRPSRVLEVLNQRLSRRVANDRPELSRLQDAGQLFQTAPQFPTSPDFPISLVTGDLRHNGKKDLVVVNFNCLDVPCAAPGSISVFLGNGDGTFQSRVDYPVEFGPLSVAIGDFNGDGKSDLVVANYCGSTPLCNSSSMSILLGVGDGTFHQHVEYPAGTEALSVAVADLNRDGKDDFVTADLLDAVTVTLGNGDGTFQPPVSYPAPADSAPTAIVVADFNGDQNLDLATANFSSSVSIFLGNGDGTFQSHLEIGSLSNPSTIAAADLNGDGNIDIVTNDINGNVADRIAILLGKGDGTFPTELSYVTGVAPTSVAIAQLTTDNAPDLAMANCFGGDVSIFPGIGDGNFSPHEAFGAGLCPVSIVTGDFDNDGHVDIAALTSENTIVILKGQGDGTFASRIDSDTFVHPVSIAAADFNRDGKMDLVTANNIDARVSVLLGKGNGSFEPHVDYETGGLSVAVTTADLNGDGNPDLIVANYDNSTIAVLLGNRDGTFRPPVKYASNCNPDSVATADVNHDGKLDVIVGNSGCDLSVQVFLGNGDGTLRAHSDFAVGTFVTAGVAIGDLNGDGNLDLIAVSDCAPGSQPGDCVPGGTLSILLGKGDGTFPTYNAIAFDGSGQITIGDFNRDKNLDIAIGDSILKGNSFTAVLHVWLGNGDGTLRNPTDYQVGNDVLTSIMSADLDGDGKLDLAATYGFDHPPYLLLVLLGNGDGSFQAPLPFETPIGPSFLTVSDFNGDFKPDVALASAPAYNVGVLLNIAKFPEFSLSVALAGGGGGVVTSNPAGINCGSGGGQTNCVASFVSGASVVLTATASPGSVFKGWSEDCSGISSCTLVMNSDHKVSALFQPAPDFSFTASAPSPASVSPGQSATSAMVITSLNEFNSPVSFTCSVSPIVPLGPTCGALSLTPPPDNTVSGTLKINTSGPVGTARPLSLQFQIVFALWLPLAGIVLACVKTHYKRFHRLKTTIGGLVLFVSLGFLFLPGCGGGGKSSHGGTGTPPGTYTITITGSSGNLHHSTAVPLTVQ